MIFFLSYYYYYDYKNPFIFSKVLNVARRIIISSSYFFNNLILVIVCLFSNFGGNITAYSTFSDNITAFSCKTNHNKKKWYHKNLVYNFKYVTVFSSFRRPLWVGNWGGLKSVNNWCQLKCTWQNYSYDSFMGMMNIIRVYLILWLLIIF